MTGVQTCALPISPIPIGIIVLLGLLTRQDITTIIPMGMGVAGVMVLMPRVVGVLKIGRASCRERV